MKEFILVWAFDLVVADIAVQTCYGIYVLYYKLSNDQLHPCSIYVFISCSQTCRFMIVSVCIEMTSIMLPCLIKCVPRVLAHLLI